MLQDRVKHFCAANDLKLIIRAHECVQDGYQYFASCHLITVFSATNYCARYHNDGAFLEISIDGEKRAVRLQSDGNGRSDAGPVVVMSQADQPVTARSVGFPPDLISAMVV